MRQRYSAKQWAERISEQQESGQSIEEFCSWRGVSANTFYLRRRRLEAAVEINSGTKSEHSVRVTQTVAAGFSRSLMAAAFVPVSVVPGVQTIASDLPCGATIRVPDEDNSLRHILNVLLKAGEPQRKASSKSVRRRKKKHGRRIIPDNLPTEPLERIASGPTLVTTIIGSKCTTSGYRENRMVPKNSFATTGVTCRLMPMEATTAFI